MGCNLTNRIQIFQSSRASSSQIIKPLLVTPRPRWRPGRTRRKDCWDKISTSPELNFSFNHFCRPMKCDSMIQCIPRYKQAKPANQGSGIRRSVISLHNWRSSKTVQIYLFKFIFECREPQSPDISTSICDKIRNIQDLSSRHQDRMEWSRVARRQYIMSLI